MEEELTKAQCSVCHKTVELSSSGRSALTDQAKGKKSFDIDNFSRGRGLEFISLFNLVGWNKGPFS